MAKNNSNSSRHKIAEAALRLAASKGWEAVTLEQIAKDAKIPAAKLRDIVASKEDVLTAIIERTDAAMEKAFARQKPQGSPRERLFEVIMARFDALQKDRQGMLAIISAGRANPSGAVAAIPAMARSINTALRLAAIGETISAHAVPFAGLAAIYGFTFRVWSRDETNDISKTMAALDRSLTYAERLIGLINSRK